MNKNYYKQHLFRSDRVCKLYLSKKKFLENYSLPTKWFVEYNENWMFTVKNKTQ